KTIMSATGRALMGTGYGRGDNRALEAAEVAVNSPLLDDISIQGATGILINFTAGPDIKTKEISQAASFIQQAAHEDANIIFGSVIDPNLSDEVRITVIATGVDRTAKVKQIEPQPVAVSAKVKAQQITLPYDVSSQITKEYPPPQMPRTPAKAVAHVVEEPDIDVTWDHPEMSDSEPIADGLASGSGPAPVEGTPLVQPDRKRAQSRPSMKTVLPGEIDTDNELDVPTFIRRHSASQS
ncbi:MAG TPA: hypothetical protein VGO00_25415, partial [Kofleriaceae bacterium]|nr:hypothetical protein [Kofleriaceae bacterium]